MRGSADSYHGDVEQSVVRSETKVGVDRVHAERGEKWPEGRRFRPFFMAFNFPTPGASLGKCFDTRKLKILFGESEPVVLADQRLGQVGVSVVDMAFEIGSQPADAHVAVEVIALRDLFRIAKFAGNPACRAEH